MLVIRDKANIKIEYPISEIADTDKILFFDIETTGFSRKYCNIYLIGCMYFSGKELLYTQWLAENFNDEANILMAFHKLVQNFNTIIHFNGNNFDIPFIKERGAKYKLNFCFENFKSIDIYKPLFRLNHILKMENLKQKSFEKKLSIHRQDPFSGGDLIEVFKQYVETKDERLIFPLLLHNREDVFNMGKLVSLLAIRDLFEKKFTLSNYRFQDYKNINGEIEKELLIHLDLENAIPFPLSYHHNIHFNADDKRAVLTIPVIYGTYKYFFPNPKDYYYLVLEDKAIHKSISAFVDKQYRKQATASTCYEKFSGEFLPVFDLKNSEWTQILKEDYKCKSGFIQSNILNDNNIFSYVCSILDFIKENPKKKEVHI